MRRFVGSPVPLAMLRMVVPLVIAVSPELHVAPALAASPQHLTYVPEGLGPSRVFRSIRRRRASCR
jgi:hypothetical protein